MKDPFHQHDCAAAILAHFKMDMKFSVISSFSNKDLHF